MDPLAQASHSRHETESIKSPSSEGTVVQKETSVELKENLPVADAILQDLSLLINDEWLNVAKFLKITEESLQKIHTDYGAPQKEATYRMFLGWKEEMGNNATYGALTEALRKAGRGDLADLSTELIDPQERLLVMEKILQRQKILLDPQERLLVMEKILQRQKILLDLRKRESAEKPLFPSSELYDLQEDLFLNMEVVFDCQKKLIDLKNREMAENSLFPSELYYELQKDLFLNMEIVFRFQKKLIDFTQKPEVAKIVFSSSSESHDLQESLFFIEEILNCQKSLIDRQKLELEMEKEPFLPSKLHDFTQKPEVAKIVFSPSSESHDHLQRLSIMEEKLHQQQRLLDQQKRELKMEKRLFLPSESLDSDESDEREALKKGTLDFQKNLEDKLNHFIRCLKAKYTTFVKSLKSTPWMKSEDLNIEDLFVDVGLLLWNPSQSTMTGSGWQSLDSFQALFTHPQLRRAQSINVEGESGSGKTVLLHRMAHSWCINESFTKDVKLFILLPFRCIQENYFDCSLYMTIKRFLLPMNTFLTESDVRDILTNTKSVLAVDDSSPDVGHRILLSPNRYGVQRLDFVDLWDLQLGEKLQLICFTSDYTNTPCKDNISKMTVKLQKWQKKHQLLYLQKVLPNDEKTHNLILKRLSENSTLMNECGNSLFYVLFVHLLKDDLVCGKEVTIENLSQLFKSTFESLTKTTTTKQVENEKKSKTIFHRLKSTFKNLTKNTITKPMENEKESETIVYPQGISKAAYECLRKNKWHIDLPAEERGYQMLVDVGILVQDQCDWFYKHSKHYTMSATVVTHRLVRFCHTIFQIWFAALYLSECSNVREEYERLFFFPKCLRHCSTPLLRWDKAILQRFICGLSSECSVILLEDLARGRYGDNNDKDEHFFLCLNEHCGNDDSLRAVVNAICQKKREFKLGCSNELVLKSMARIFNLATQWKIPIKCIDLRSHDLVDINDEGLTLSNGVRLGPLSAKEIKISKWLGKQLGNYLNKCEHLAETRIFASYPGHPNEIQREVEGATYNVYWNKSDETCYILEEGKWKFVDTEEEKTGGFQRPLRKEVYVDNKGASVIFGKASVSLHIPEGALPEGINISITIVNELDVKLLPDDSLPMISPIVKCEPCGLKFRKPVTLVLPHCGIAEDINNTDAVFFRGDCSGKTIKWEMIEGGELSVSETECCLPITHFCFFYCKVKNLKAKRMRAVPFTRLRHEERSIRVKLWICNDYVSTFDEIKEDEINMGYKRAGAWQNFTIYRSLGNIEVDCRRHEKGTIDFNNIWRGSRGNVVFSFPTTDGTIDETLFVKQKRNDDTSRIEFDIVDVILQAPKNPPIQAPRKRTYQCTSDDMFPPEKKFKVTENSATLYGVPFDETDFKEQRYSSRGQLDQPGCSRTAKIPQRSKQMKAFKASDVVRESSLLPEFPETIQIPHGSNQLELFNESEVVSESSLLNLSRLLGQEWKTLGRKLGLSESFLEDLESSNSEMKYQMLLKWKRKRGKKATYGRLCAGLQQVDRKDLVEVKEEVEKWVYSQTTENAQ